MFLSILQKLPRNRTLNIQFMPSIYRYSTNQNDKQDEKEPEVPVNLLKDVYSAHNQIDNGYVYDKKPMKFSLKAGRIYSWCLCGRSKSQPFCDGTHRNIFWKIKLRPIKFKVNETKDYWLCNCKQTKNRPFCDGTHLDSEIQELRR